MRGRWEEGEATESDGADRWLIASAWNPHAEIQYNKENGQFIFIVPISCDKSKNRKNQISILLG